MYIEREKAGSQLVIIRVLESLCCLVTGSTSNVVSGRHRPLIEFSHGLRAVTRASRWPRSLAGGVDRRVLIGRIREGFFFFFFQKSPRSSFVIDLIDGENRESLNN